MKARIAGIDAGGYAGPHDDYARVDQVNMKLPRSLTGRGGAVELTVEGQASNLAYGAFK